MRKIRRFFWIRSGCQGKKNAVIMIGAYIFRIHDLMVKADNSQPRGGFEFQRRILHYAKVPNIECQAGQIKMLQYRFHQAKLVVNVLFFSIFLFLTIHLLGVGGQVQPIRRIREAESRLRVDWPHVRHLPLRIQRKLQPSRHAL